MSNALHTVWRCTLALNTISVALSISAAASTYVWQTPIPPVTAGILASRATMCTRSAPPRGISRSMYSSIWSIVATSCLSVDAMHCTASAGSPTDCNARLTTSARARFVRIASLPPRISRPLPDLMHNALASTVTFGRDSQIRPMTPSAVRTRLMRSPLSATCSDSTSPTGSSKSAMARTAEAISARRERSSNRRSVTCSSIPSAVAADTSSAFAANISSAHSSRPAAKARNAPFRVSVLDAASCFADSRHARPIRCKSVPKSVSVAVAMTFDAPVVRFNPNQTNANLSRWMISIFRSLSSSSRSPCKMSSILSESRPTTAFTSEAL